MRVEGLARARWKRVAARWCARGGGGAVQGRSLHIAYDLGSGVVCSDVSGGATGSRVGETLIWSRLPGLGDAGSEGSESGRRGEGGGGVEGCDGCDGGTGWR